MMNKPIHIRTALLAFAVSAGLAMMGAAPAQANGCAAIASQVAAQEGGRVLSATESGGKCTIVVLVPAKNGPPRKKTVVVSK